jgi:hypothetical protein
MGLCYIAKSEQEGDPNNAQTSFDDSRPGSQIAGRRTTATEEASLR